MIDYEDLTVAQKEAICNGCGGKGSWVKPPHRIFFKASCNHHDYGYYKGCTEKDRLAADQKLYKRMQEDCIGLPMFKKIQYKPWCWLYYRAIRMMGGSFFYYADKQREPPDI